MNNRYDEILQIKQRDKALVKKYGEVFTPPHLVDKMINKIPDEKWKTNFTTLDMCAGIGMFTMGIIRKKKSLIRDFNVHEWLINYHYFNELNEDNCVHLKYIFGDDINMFIGDARKLVSVGNVKGIWKFNESVGWKKYEI